jgi:hypothetical protein
MEFQLSRITPGRILSIVGLFLACLGLFSMDMTPAAADTTHVFLRQFAAGSGYPQPFGVDSEGNIYVYRTQSHTIGKYSPEGEPVAFSALGTNTIDGEGGNSCPEIPTDCDATPTNGLYVGGEGGNSPNGVVALDTSTGPAHGDIYVLDRHSNQNIPGRINVFDHTGTYIGEIHQQPVPYSCLPGCNPNDVYLDSNGHIYLLYEYKFQYDVHSRAFRVDEYVPIDENPAHDKFAGELDFFNENQHIPEEVFCCTSDIAPTPNFIYAYDQYLLDESGFAGDFRRWERFSSAGFHETPPAKAPESVVNGSPLFDGFGFEEHEVGYEHAVVNPGTNHLFLQSFQNVVEFNGNNEQIGPPFGAGQYNHSYASGTFLMAFDNSGGPHDGEIYTSAGANLIAAFSPPRIVPDVHLEEPDVLRESATVKAKIGSAGGPAITDCLVEYGTYAGPDYYTGEKTYEHSIPCQPNGPYGSEAQVTAQLQNLTPNSSVHYRFVVINENGTSKVNDHVLHTVAVINVRTEDATDLTPHTASLNGSLDPDGIDTKAHFDFGPDRSYGQSTPAVDLGSGNSDEAVPSVPVSKLQAGRTYHVRLVAENEFGTTYGPDVTFETPNHPAIVGVRAVNVAESSAELVARIDPGDAETRYRFEYGPTVRYGTSVPTPDGQLASITGPEEVTVHLEDLAPGTAYHFRVLAENQWGNASSDDSTFAFRQESCPNAQVRQQTRATLLPDCRAYELVTPSNAGSVQFFPGDSTSHLSRIYGELFASPPQNGGGLAISPARLAFYGAFGSVPGTEPPDSNQDLYVSTRTPSGWQVTLPGLKGSEALAAGDPHCSSTLSQCFEYRRSFILQKPYGSNSPYLFQADGKFAGRLPTNYAEVPKADVRQGYARASADFSHFVFSSRNVAFAPGALTEAPGSAYDNNLGTGEVTIVSKRPDGSNLPQEPSNAGHTTDVIEIPMVSNNGSRILLGAASRPVCHGEPNNLCEEEPEPAAPLHLYMRVNDAVTYDVSRGADVQYLGATPGGSRVYFMTPQSLVPQDTDNSNDLYVWEEATDSLKILSQGGEAGNTDSCSASWTEGCGTQPVESTHPLVDRTIALESGEVYFFSPEQLDPSNPGIPDQRNLYVYSQGTVHYITTLDPGTSLTRFQTTPAGSHAAFITDSRLLAYENAGHDEMYEYDRETGALKCVSCDPTGTPPQNDVRGSASGLFITNDGRTFFSTKDPLTPQDTDGLTDIYEYVNGRPYLISGGTATLDGWGGSNAEIYPPFTIGLESVSANGIDVYFSTYESLVPQDDNGAAMKFYDARTNGGFLAKEELPPCTAADECHGPTAPEPAVPQVGTGADLGEPPTKFHRKKRHGSDRHKKKHHRHHHGSQSRHQRGRSLSHG